MATFFGSERFEELWRFQMQDEARCVALWYLLDRAPLHEAYTSFSVAMKSSPVHPNEAFVAMEQAAALTC